MTALLCWLLPCIYGLGEQPGNKLRRLAGCPPFFQYPYGNRPGWSIRGANRLYEPLKRCLKLLRFCIKPDQLMEDTGFEGTTGYVGLLVTRPLTWQQVSASKKQ
jgi:hypothetical protein